MVKKYGDKVGIGCFQEQLCPSVYTSHLHPYTLPYMWCLKKLFTWSAPYICNSIADTLHTTCKDMYVYMYMSVACGCVVQLCNAHLFYL